MLKFEHIIVYIASCCGRNLDDFDGIAKCGSRFMVSDIAINVSNGSIRYDVELLTGDGRKIIALDVNVPVYVDKIIWVLRRQDQTALVDSFILDEDFMEVVHQYHNMNRL